MFISDFSLYVDSPYPIPQRETYKQKPEPLPYPKRHPKYAHLGKNLEVVIDKALREEDPEKKAGFAHAIAYYMKLAYSNWHKELVHDDTIRTELDSITGGELEFSNTPYIKHRNQNFERDDYGTGRSGRWQQNFGGRNQGGNRGNNRNNNNNRNKNGNNRNNGNKSCRNLRIRTNPSKRNCRRSAPGQSISAWWTRKANSATSWSPPKRR